MIYQDGFQDIMPVGRSKKHCMTMLSQVKFALRWSPWRTTRPDGCLDSPSRWWSKMLTVLMAVRTGHPCVASFMTG